MAMNKGLKIAIGVATIGFVGVGVYFLVKHLKKKNQEKIDEKKQGSRGSVSETSVKSKAYNKRPVSTSSQSLGKTPFKNKAEGDKFRGWVNDNHSDYAKKIDLDRSGSYDNAFIRKAWKQYGVDYGDSTNTDVVVNLKYGSKFDKIAKDWKKSIFTSGSSSTKGVPYFSISMKDNIGENWCDLEIYIYDRLKGESVGGKNGEGYWKVVRTGYGTNKTIAWGRWDDNLRTIKVTNAKDWAGNELSSKGQTFSGGMEVGRKFAQAIGSLNRKYAWC